MRQKAMHVSAEYTGSLSQDGWLALTRVKCDLDVVDNNNAVMRLTLKAIENGVQIAESSFETRIQGMLPSS